MKKPALKIAENGLIIDERGVPQSRYCDSFQIAEAVTKNADGVIFRLAHSGVTEMTPGATIALEEATQFVMETHRARKLANALLSACDEIDGIGHPLQ